MKLSSTSLKKNLRDILERRKKLLGIAAGTDPLIVGNVYDVMRRCGNRYCHCAAKPGHRQTLLIYTEKGRRTCKLVRRKDEERVKQAWQNYRNSRQALREIRTINRRELALIRAEISRRRLRYV